MLCGTDVILQLITTCGLCVFLIALYEVAYVVYFQMW